MENVKIDIIHRPQAFKSHGLRVKTGEAIMKKHRFFAVALALLMLLQAAPTVAFADGGTSNGDVYIVGNDELLWILGHKDLLCFALIKLFGFHVFCLLDLSKH